MYVFYLPLQSLSIHGIDSKCSILSSTPPLSFIPSSLYTCLLDVKTLFSIWIFVQYIAYIVSSECFLFLFLSSHPVYLTLSSLVIGFIVSVNYTRFFFTFFLFLMIIFTARHMCSRLDRNLEGRTNYFMHNICNFCYFLC